MSDFPGMHAKDVERRFLEALRSSFAPTEEGSPPVFVPENMRVLAVNTPSFLIEGVFLVQAEVASSSLTITFWSLFLNRESNSIVRPFLDRSRSFPRTVCSIEAELETKGEQQRLLRINSETIREYLAVVMNHELARDDPAGILVADDDHLSDTFGSLEWATPLEEVEKRSLRAALEGHPIEIRPGEHDSLLVDACVLEQDALVRKEFKVLTADTQTWSVAPGVVGDIRLGARAPRILVEGLPANYRVQPGVGLGTTQYRFAVDPEGWESLSPVDCLPILSDLDRRLVSPLDPTQLARIRRQHLPFYKLDLLRLEPGGPVGAKGPDEAKIAYILWKPGFAMPLDATSAPIHQLNLLLGTERGSGPNGGRVIDNASDAVLYSVFFCRYVWGEEGPFVVLKGGNDPALEVLDLEHAEFDADRFDSVSAVLAAISEPTATEVPSSDDEPTFEVTTWILYGETVFTARLRVSTNGSIEMLDDNPALSGKVTGTPFPRHRVLQRVSGSTGATCIAACELESKMGEGIHLEDLVVTGQITRESLTVRMFRRCRFRGRVDLQFLASERGLGFEDCVFENGLDLSGSHLRGTLSLERCVVVQGRHHPGTSNAKPFAFENASFESLQLNHVSTTGGLSANGMRIRGAIVIFQSELLGELGLSALTAQSLQVEAVKAKGGIELNSCIVEQFVNLKNVRTTHGSGVSLYGAEITHNYLALDSVAVEGDLEATFLRVGTGFFLESSGAANTIGGSINLGGARIPSILRIRNTHVAKSIRAKAVVAGDIVILGGGLRAESQESVAAVSDVAERPVVEEVAGPDANRTADTSHIGGAIDISDSEIQHHVTALDLDVGADPKEAESCISSLVLHSAKIGGSVRLYSTAEAARISRWHFPTSGTEDEFSGTWRRGLHLKDATIGGAVDLSGVRCANGAINLENAEVERDIVLRRRRSGGPATAVSLALAGLKCRGTADISGVDLSGTKTPSEDDPCGAVVATMASFSKLVAAKTLQEAAIVPGRLDLSGSTIGELALSVSSFDDVVSDTNLKIRGIILNRATVDKISAIRTKGRCPRPIDLRFSEIRWWEFRGDPDDPSSSDFNPVEDYVHLLDGDPNKMHHTFRAIEQNLFSQGLDDAADEIHKQMRRWLREHRTGRWRRLKNGASLVWDVLTDSSTSANRLVWIVLVWLVFSTAVFSNPANIRPSDDGLSRDKAMSANTAPLGANWGPWAGFWMAARFHVPGPVFTARHEWEPGTDPGLTVVGENREFLLPEWISREATRYTNSNLRYDLPVWKWSWVSPEAYANFVLAVHSVLLPVILYLFSRKAFRRRDQ